MKQIDAISIGEALIDFVPGKEKDTFIANVGGAPANVAAALAQNGVTTAFLGKLGEDSFGDKIADTLESKGITLLCKEREKSATTTMAFVTLSEQGERSFTFARKPGADMLLSVDDVKESVVGECRLLCAGGLGITATPVREAVIYAMQTVSRMGHVVAFDINFRPGIMNKEAVMGITSMAMYMVDLLKISEEELFFVGGRENIPAYMRKYSLKAVILTLGDKGADYYLKNGDRIEIGHEDAVLCTVVDTTGAGDAFWGTFLAVLLQTTDFILEHFTISDIQRAVLEGNKAGADCIGHKGGML